MKRQNRATKECYTLSEGLYDSIDSAYDSMSSSMMSSIADQKTLNEPRTFDSWEEYHRSDTSKTGLLFLYIYLRDRPGRQADAESVLKQYYNWVDICTKPASAPMTINDLTGPTEDKTNSNLCLMDIAGLHSIKCHLLAIKAGTVIMYYRLCTDKFK